MFRNRIHIATAAVVLLLLAVTFTCMTGSPDGANTAWGDVATVFGQIDHFHDYTLVSRDNTLTTSEGWYAHQKLHSRNDQPQVEWFDDGQYRRAYDEHQNLVVLAPSELETCSTPLSVLDLGLEAVTTDSLKGLTPETVGDFLIYSFPPPPQHQDWLDRISVTVGKDSLLPTQVKIYNKPRPRMENYTLIVFDYDEPEKPLDFFDPPTQSLPPHGQAKIKLGGPPVEIEVKGAPGIDKAIVRLKRKFEGDLSDLLIPYRGRHAIGNADLYFADISFVTDEGYQSITAENIPLWINQGAKCALGKKGNWPDELYRNIRYTPVLRPTDRPDEFMLEISCWMRVRHSFL